MNSTSLVEVPDETVTACRSSGVYSRLLGQDYTACQWASRRAAGCSCLRGLISRELPCRARALDAQFHDLNCAGSRIGSAFCGGRGLRVGSMTSMVAVCAILYHRAAHRYSLLYLNNDSAPLAITVRCRICEFGTVSISSGVRHLLELRASTS